MRLFLSLVLISLLSTNALADDPIKWAKERVAESLSDPDSAKFRHMRIQSHEMRDCSHVTFICGEVNFRGAFGGFEGFRPFWVNTQDGYVMMGWDCDAPRATETPSCH